ncbi:hypothetical protein DevBK_02465 [Devosia sp. BK]|uniref:DUF7946 domain-containing protein n=1 Tax=Devosia sp. BK TaxID=2871706 RepID=UPI00293A637C|nr:hypothetical protein [Devosia sp. BK]MDV3250190.1 hypothetical protein [Devosia sp. BK]
MASSVVIRAQLTGGDADRHQIPAYDGFTSLAGLGLTLSLTANYIETGKIRRRGDFAGRHSVKATPIEEGSVLTDFLVSIPRISLPFARKLSDAASSEFVADLVKGVIDRNLGVESEPTTDELSSLLEHKDGDFEALVAATEPSLKQAHTIIGEGAQVMNLFGSKHQLGQLNQQSKKYIHGTVEDPEIYNKDVSVASFNVNSGYGGVYDPDLRRVVSIKVTPTTMPQAKSVLGWGLNEYANGTGKRVHLQYYRWMTLDDRPKKYIVIDAKIPKDD